MSKHPNKAPGLWLVIGLASYLLFPWYAIQDTAWYYVLPQILGGSETANGLMQALANGRNWLLSGLLGLGMAAAGLALPAGKQQGRWLLAGGLVGLLGLIGSGFLIGARGWSFEVLNTSFGELAINQFGMGMGAFIALLSLVVVTAFGLARIGYFKGDLFVAAAVVCCSALLALFIAFPVVKALSGAFLTEEGQWRRRRYSSASATAASGTSIVWAAACNAG